MTEEEATGGAPYEEPVKPSIFYQVPTEESLKAKIKKKDKIKED